MKVTLLDLPLRLPRSNVERSQGVHLSGIIRSIAAHLGILKGEWLEEADFSLTDTREITDPASILRICLGLAWEEFFIRTQLPHVVDHPGEMCVDDIYMTPDGESLDVILTDKGISVHEIAMHEVKFTYKSLRRVAPRLVEPTAISLEDLESQWMWLSQMKGYVKGAREASGLPVRKAYLHVLFACGDYTWPMSPMLKSWCLEFTDEEIDANWELMTEWVKHKQGE